MLIASSPKPSSRGRPISDGNHGCRERSGGEENVELRRTQTDAAVGCFKGETKRGKTGTQIEYSAA